MPPDQPVTLADVERLVAAEHHVTNLKLEVIRAEGKERERVLTHASTQVEINLRAYADDLHREMKEELEKNYQAIRRGVENETSCLQAGLDTLHQSIFGNGNMDESIAYRLKVSETSQARWEKIASRLFWGLSIPATLGIGVALWMLVSGQWELVVH